MGMGETREGRVGRVMRALRALLEAPQTDPAWKPTGIRVIYPTADPAKTTLRKDAKPNDHHSAKPHR